MNFSTWSIRQPVPAIAAFLVLLMMGLYSFSRLAVTAMPNIDLPLVSIVVSQPGAAPSELVRQVIQPIEDEIASIVGASRPKINRSILALEEAGAIRRNDGIIHCHIGRLQNIAEPDDD